MAARLSRPWEGPPGVLSGPLDNSLACVWEDLFHQAPPAQQRAYLARAGQQGVLYSHQLDDLPATPLLPVLLNGRIKDLPPLKYVPLEDQAELSLDAAQQEAVQRALATPDLCLIQGLPGTGKSRVAAEVVLQAAGRGERVLLLTASTAALDGILGQLAGHDHVCPIRCLEPGESGKSLPPDIFRLTLAERVRYFEENTLQGARQALQTARQRLEQCRREEALWPRFHELAVQYQELEAPLRAVQEKRSTLAANLDAELSGNAGPSSSALQARIGELERAWNDTWTQRDARLNQLRAELAKTRLERDEVRSGLNKLQPLAEARLQGRWWTWHGLKALFQGQLLERFRLLQGRQQELDTLDTRLAGEASQAESERQQAEAELRESKLSLLRQEQERRQAELNAQREALEGARRLVEEKWQLACQECITAVAPASALRQADPLQAVNSGQQAWARLREELEQQGRQAEEWLAGVEQAQAIYPNRLIRHANVVAATTSAWARDAHFGGQQGARAPVEFDLLVVEEADQLTESEIVQSAQRARRWVLVGEPIDFPEPVPSPEGNGPGPERPREGAGPGRSATGRVVRAPAALRPGFFQGMWQQLHGDPRRLPYRWYLKQNRLHCSLRPVPPEQQSWIQSETVADRPEIELRILVPPRDPPQLAEVIFPASMTLAQAKEYIFQELQELPVQAHGWSLRWLDKPGQIVARLSGFHGTEVARVALDKGVRELLAALPGERSPGEDGPLPWRTCCLEFDCEAGWDRERAEQWIGQHLPMSNAGRTVLLTNPHRMRPALASWVWSILFEEPLLVEESGRGCPNAAPVTNGTLNGGPSHSNEIAVEFVAVPTLSDTAEARRRNEAQLRRRGGGTATVAPRQRGSRGGAGLEVDLADSRRIDPMPVELRGCLPERGLVNFLEAQALVRYLEAMLADAHFQADAARWRQAGRGPTVAVIALYPAQAELIIRLMERCPALAGSGVEVEVGVPGTFRHRECHTALVSLTRSHTHRAVSFGDKPAGLVVALTRAAWHLVLFGDPGTLARRSQWLDPVDHLDGPLSLQEHGLISRLSAALQCAEANPAGTSFRLHEGGTS